MSVNKNALIRYKVLDTCFKNVGKKYFIQDLIEACEKVLLEIDPASDGISRRQIFDDIAFMESREGWGIELQRKRIGKRVFYQYSDPDFSINNMPLNEVEIQQLQSAADILSQFKGMPQFEWVNELLPKLKIGLAPVKTKETIIAFESNQYLKGIQYLGVLYNAIYNKKTLTIRYQSFESDVPLDYEFHPYYLKQYNNRWFAFGNYPDMKKYNWNFALDRIRHIEEGNTKYIINDKINWEEYFEDIVGVTKPDNATLENIVLHFVGKTGHYIESKPIHGSQKVHWLKNNILEVRLQLIINYEFEQFLLSYADSVLIIKPSGLKKLIKKRLHKSLELY